MLVLAFGSGNDRQAWQVADKIKKYFPGVKFVKTENPDDVFSYSGKIVIIDSVKGIKKTVLLSLNDIKKRNIYTLHDFDLAFFLNLMKDMKKISDVKIIGVPMKLDKNVVEDARKMLESVI